MSDKKQNLILKYLKDHNVVIILILIFISACLASTQKFVKITNFYILLQSISTYGILAIGLTFVFLVGGIDLSIAYQVGTCGTCMVLANNASNVWVGIAVALLLGVALGYLNGTIVTRLKIPPLIGTLAVMTALNGIVLLLNKNSGNQSIKNASIAGMPLPQIYNLKFFQLISPSMILAVIMLVALGLFLKYTRTGANMYITGGNPEAGEYAGINNGRLTRIAYSICGFCSGLCAVLSVFRLGASTYNMGDNLDITAIAAVVIGGVKMQGGKGNMGMCIMGVAVIQIINNAMIKMGLHSSMQALVTGIVLILVLILDKFTNKETTA